MLLLLRNLFGNHFLSATVLMIGSMTAGEAFLFWQKAGFTIEFEIYHQSPYGNAFPIIVTVTSFFATVFLHFIYARLNFKQFISLSSILSAISWFIMTYSTKYVVLLLMISAILLGVSISLFNILNPIYLLSLATREQIDAFGILHPIGISLGSIVCILLGNFINWRFLCLIFGFISTLHLVLVHFIPDFDTQYLEQLKKARISERKASRVKSYVHCIFLAFLPFFGGYFDEFLSTNEYQLYRKPLYLVLTNVFYILMFFVTFLLVYYFEFKVLWIISCLLCCVSQIASAVLTGMHFDQKFNLICYILFVVSFRISLDVAGWSMIPRIDINLLSSLSLIRVTCYGSYYVFRLSGNQFIFTLITKSISALICFVLLFYGIFIFHEDNEIGDAVLTSNLENIFESNPDSLTSHLL